MTSLTTEPLKSLRVLCANGSNLMSLDTSSLLDIESLELSDTKLTAIDGTPLTKLIKIFLNRTLI